MNTTKPLKTFKDLNIAPPKTIGMEGPKIDMNKLFGRQIIVHGYTIGPSKLPGKEHTSCLTLQISLDGNKRVVFSGSKYLLEACKQLNEDDFPFSTIIVKCDNDSHQFT